MKLSLLNSGVVYVEIGQSSLKVLEGEIGLELPLERLENGRLTAPGKENLISRLRGFLGKQGWGLRPRALCAIGARGVSFRRLTLPSAPKEELQKLLLLQIESEFPLPPDELAWGYKTLEARNGGKQELLVVAVKREVLEEYSDLLSACGLNPVFTLGALARSSLCSRPPKSFAVLDIGRKHSELVCFENGAPTTLRVLQWGGEDITQSIQKTLQISRDEAENLKLAHGSAPNGELAPAIQSATSAALEALAEGLKGNWTEQKLYLAGRSARLKDFSSRLAELFGNGVECEPIEPLQGEGRSAAILGLKSGNGEVPSVILQGKRSKGGEAVHRNPWKWAAAAGLLIVISLALRYAEPLLLKPRLSQRLSQMKSYQERLPRIDRELAFLRFLKTNQPPYLDGIWAMAAAAPPGIRFDSLAMNRRGEVSLRGTLGDAQHVVDFRSKLIDSGLFSTVSVDEQTPGADRQKLTIRVSAQWKPSSERKAAASSPPGRESEQARISVKEMGGALTNAAPSAKTQRLSSTHQEVAVDGRTNSILQSR